MGKGLCGPQGRCGGFNQCSPHSFEQKRNIGFDQDQKSADLPCATNHKYETSKNTGARAFTMPLAIGSSSLYDI